jgi:uncharacterized protein involved in exopolysaccharide biosynthesis
VSKISQDMDHGEVIELRVLFLALWKRRLWLFVAVILSTAAFASAAILIKPVYRAATILLPTSSERGNLGGALGSALGQLGGLASLAGVGSRDGTTEEALAVLRSRDFTEKFITENRLLPKLFSKQWNASADTWAVTADRQPTAAKAYKYFSKNVRFIDQDKKTGLVTLRIDWKDRLEAATWANELGDRLNAEMRKRAIAKSDASIAYLEKALLSTSEIGTRDAINRLIEAQVKQRMLANVTQEFVFSVVDKAMPPDSDDPVWPNKSVLFVVGPLVGLAFGLMLIFLAHLMRSEERS